MQPCYLIRSFFRFHEMIINLGGDVYRSQRQNKLMLLFFVGDRCLSRIKKNKILILIGSEDISDRGEMENP